MQQKLKQKQESCAVYVSGLPLDIQEGELRALFDVCGKIKKVKIYLDGNSNPQGDALVTYYHSEHASNSILKVSLFCFVLRCFFSYHFYFSQFHNLTVENGHVLKVSRANFDVKSSETLDSSLGNPGKDLKNPNSIDIFEGRLWINSLPVECELIKYSVVILKGFLDNRFYSMEELVELKVSSC